MIYTLSLLALCAVWALLAVMSVRTSRSLQVLDEQTIGADAALPRLSVIIAACNEASTLGDALATLVAQDYPGLEIIVVNDRSTDATGAILDAMAAQHACIRPVHIESLPQGWLGKVHALHRAAARATGEWILFTDADVHFSRDAIRTAVGYVTARRKDHLVVVPKVTIAPGAGFWLDLAVTSFGALFLQKVRATDLEKPGSHAYAGAGGFNLIRRAALAQTPGFEWLRMEVADDVGLGLMLKRAGFTTTLLVSTGDVSVAWYASLGQMFQGLEKNGFLFACRASLARLIGATLLVGAYVLAPWAALMHPDPALQLAGGLALAAFAGSALAASRRYSLRPAAALMLPVGLLIIMACLWRSAVVCLRQGGITWRGTFYPLAELKRLQRVRL